MHRDVHGRYTITAILEEVSVPDIWILNAVVFQGWFLSAGGGLSPDQSRAGQGKVGADLVDINGASEAPDSVRRRIITALLYSTRCAFYLSAF